VTDAALPSSLPYREPTQSSLARAMHVVHRNFLVWRKLLWPSLVGNLADPLIYLVGLGYGLGRFVPEMAGLPYLHFLAAGMICYSTMNSASFEALYSAYTRLGVQRTWEAILHAPMTVRDIVVGEWLWAGLKSALSGMAILVVMYGLGIVKGFAPVTVLPVVLLVGLAFAGIALVITTLAKSYDFFVYYFTLLITPMMLVSGVFFPIDQLPRAVQGVASFLPLVHGTELARGIALGTPIERPFLNVFVLAVYGIVGVSVAVRLAQRRLAK
jgi:lipooligosaccharide transport system permease protein